MQIKQEKKEQLVEAVSRAATREEALEAIDEVLGNKRTPLEQEIEAIWAKMRANPELKDTGIKIIKTLKLNARGEATDAQVTAQRKIWNAVIAAVEE